MFEDFRLKVFMTLAEKGSFTQAAKALGITQPAVSQSIAELERSVGATLFARTRGSVTLSPSGMAFKEYAGRILYWYASAGRMFGPEGKLTGGKRIKIASDRTISDYILPDILSKLLAFSDSVSFELTGPESADNADLVISGKKHTSELRLDDDKVFAVEVPAVAVSSNPAYSKIVRFQDLPGNARLAVLKAYSENLGPDIQSRIALISDSVEGILRLASANPDIVAIVPLAASPSELSRLAIPLPTLSTDFFLLPSATFASDPAFSAIKRLFTEL